jgi:hypothetical protein
MVDSNDNIWICANQEDEIVRCGQDRQGDRQARRFRGHRSAGYCVRTADPGKLGLEPGRQMALRHKPDPVPAVCQCPVSRRSSRESNRLRLDVASEGLHRIRASGQDLAISG